eukprot:5358158-Prymnesium_polylepis.1
MAASAAFAPTCAHRAHQCWGWGWDWGRGASEVGGLEFGFRLGVGSGLGPRRLGLGSRFGARFFVHTLAPTCTTECAVNA